MIRDIVEATGLVRNGKPDTLRIGVIAVILLVFWGYRFATSDVSDDAALLASLEDHLLNEYRESVYRKAGLLDENPENDNDAWMELVNLTVTIQNASVAAPLFSFSANERIGLRFDYQLRVDGLVREQGYQVTMTVDPRRSRKFLPCSAFTYYLQYL